MATYEMANRDLDFTNRGLHIENLSNGDILTVIRWQPREVVETDGCEMVLRTVEDLAYCGDLLRVLAVSPPYIAVEEVNRHNHRVRIDTRRCILTRPNEDYVKALRGDRDS